MSSKIIVLLCLVALAAAAPRKLIFVFCYLSTNYLQFFIYQYLIL